MKLKTADFRLRTRSRRVADPTQLAATLYNIASGLLAGEVDGVTRFRLVGVAADHLSDSRAADPPTLFARQLDSSARLEEAIGVIRGKLGEAAVEFGRALRHRRNGA